jgi:hypothetical protein
MVPIFEKYEGDARPVYMPNPTTGELAIVTEEASKLGETAFVKFRGEKPLGGLKTAEYIPHRLACRYKWLAMDEPKRKQTALISPKWNGDPGAVPSKARNH